MIAIPYPCLVKFIDGSVVKFTVWTWSSFLGWLLAKKLWDNHTRWMDISFISFVGFIFSSYIKRNLCLFLIVAMFGVVNWVRDDS